MRHNLYNTNYYVIKKQRRQELAMNRRSWRKILSVLCATMRPKKKKKICYSLDESRGSIAFICVCLCIVCVCLFVCTIMHDRTKNG